MDEKKGQSSNYYAYGKIFFVIIIEGNKTTTM